MTEQQVMEQPETLGLVKVDVLNAVQVFTGGGMNAILDSIEAKVRAIQLDASTVEGRDQIRSVAYRVVRTKTALDAEGKKLTEEWRKNTAKVNEERKKSFERLDALAEEVRKPLTDFENKDKIRVAAHEAALAEMAGLLTMLQKYPDMAVKLLEEHLVDFSGLHAGRDWEEFADRAKKLRHEVSSTLIGRIEARKKYDVEQAELTRLRAEEAARLQRERDERLQAEAAEKARLEAERKAQEAAEAERQRVEAETEKVRLHNERIRKEAEDRAAKAEADRLATERRAEENRIREENARLAAEQRAKDAEEAAIAAAKKAESDRVVAAQKAQAEKIALEKKAAAEKLAAEVRAAGELKAAQEKAQRDADAAAQRERDKIEQERQRVETERRLRERDKAHKTRIRSEIITDLEGLGLTFDLDVIADALMAGKIRNVKVVF